MKRTDTMSWQAAFRIYIGYVKEIFLCRSEIATYRKSMIIKNTRNTMT